MNFTQNVDRLHHVAAQRLSSNIPPILELHGSLSEVRCVSKGNSSPKETSWWEKAQTNAFGRVDRYYPTHTAKTDADHGCGFVCSRDALQDQLTVMNPGWYEWSVRLKNEPHLSLRRNPDGDVQLEGVSYDTFSYPTCPNCGGIIKPDVVFFGENVRKTVREQAKQWVNECDALLLVGTTVATYSAYRLVRDVKEAGKPIVLLNRGPTRVDPLVDVRIGFDSASVLSHLRFT